jgi:hypothetical protein
MIILMSSLICSTRWCAIIQSLRAKKAGQPGRLGLVSERSPDRETGGQAGTVPPSGSTAAVKQGRAIFIVEGEKDVETLRALGCVATCNPMGAGKWHEEYSEFLRDANIVLIPIMMTLAASTPNRLAALFMVRLNPSAGWPSRGKCEGYHRLGGKGRRH